MSEFDAVSVVAVVYAAVAVFIANAAALSTNNDAPKAAD